MTKSLEFTISNFIVHSKLLLQAQKENDGQMETVTTTSPLKPTWHNIYECCKHQARTRSQNAPPKTLHYTISKTETQSSNCRKQKITFIHYPLPHIIQGECSAFSQSGDISFAFKFWLNFNWNCRAVK